MLRLDAVNVTKLVQNSKALQKWENSLLDEMMFGLGPEKQISFSLKYF